MLWRTRECRALPRERRCKLTLHPERGTASVDYKEGLIKSVYLNFDPGDLSTTRCRPRGGTEWDIRKNPGGSQFQILKRAQLPSWQKLSQMILSKVWLSHQDWESPSIQDTLKGNSNTRQLVYQSRIILIHAQCEQHGSSWGRFRSSPNPSIRRNKARRLYI